MVKLILPLTVAGAVGIPAIGYAIKKGALKQVPKIAKAVVKVFSGDDLT